MKANRKRKASSKARTRTLSSADEERYAKVTTSVRIPVYLHEAAKVCATVAGSNFNSFVAMAIAQRVKNWRDPVSGKRVARLLADAGELASVVTAPDTRLAGWVCVHSSHGSQMPASECPNGDKWSHRNSWIHPDVETNFNEWVAEV
jgi:hypothetical protein